MDIRILEEHEIKNAHTLIINVFHKCCAGDFSIDCNNCFYEGNSLELFLNGYRKREILIWGVL